MKVNSVCFCFCFGHSQRCVNSRGAVDNALVSTGEGCGGGGGGDGSTSEKLPGGAHQLEWEEAPGTPEELCRSHSIGKQEVRGSQGRTPWLCCDLLL